MTAHEFIAATAEHVHPMVTLFFDSIGEEEVHRLADAYSKAWNDGDGFISPSTPSTDFFSSAFHVYKRKDGNHSQEEELAAACKAFYATLQGKAKEAAIASFTREEAQTILNASELLSKHDFTHKSFFFGSTFKPNLFAIQWNEAHPQDIPIYAQPSYDF